MAAVKCAGCGTFISARGLENCPKCRAPIAPIPDSRLPESPNTRKIPRANHAPGQAAVSNVGAIIGGICVLGIVISIGVIGWGITNPSTEKIRKRALAEALVQCQEAIKSTAAYGGADMPPYAKNYGSADDEFYFAWPRGSFEFTNSFGGKELMSASCTGILSTRTITHLTVNSRDVISIPH